MEAGRWKVEGGRWKVEGGRWKVEGGRWKVEGGSWKLENGRLRPLAGVEVTTAGEGRSRKSEAEGPVAGSDWRGLEMSLDLHGFSPGTGGKHCRTGTAELFRHHYAREAAT